MGKPTEARDRQRKDEPRSSCATRGLYLRAPLPRSRAGEKAQASNLPKSEQSSSSGDMPRRIVLPSRGVPRSVRRVRRLLADACWLSARQLSRQRVQPGQPPQLAHTVGEASPALSLTTASVRSRDTTSRSQARPIDLTSLPLPAPERGIPSPTRRH